MRNCYNIIYRESKDLTTNLRMKQKHTKRHRDPLVVAKGEDNGGGMAWELGLGAANYYL